MSAIDLFRRPRLPDPALRAAELNIRANACRRLGTHWYRQPQLATLIDPSPGPVAYEVRALRQLLPAGNTAAALWQLQALAEVLIKLPAAILSAEAERCDLGCTKTNWMVTGHNCALRFAHPPEDFCPVWEHPHRGTDGSSSIYTRRTWVLGKARCVRRARAQGTPTSHSLTMVKRRNTPIGCEGRASRPRTCVLRVYLARERIHR